jgi:hypothetical protein
MRRPWVAASPVAIEPLPSRAGRAAAPTDHRDVQEAMHPVTLQFGRTLEVEFQEEYFRRTIMQVRGALLLGLLLYTVFGLLDAWIAREYRHVLWTIRYAIVAPFLILAIALTYHPSFQRYRDFVVAVAVLIASLGIVAMTAIIPAPGNYLYYAGLLLAIVYTFTLVRLSIVISTAISLATMSAYLVVAVALSETPPELIANNGFFLTSTIVIGFSANYTMAKYARTTFLQRRVIEMHTAQLEEKNAELVVKNKLLAESRAETLSTARRSELMFSALSETLPGTVLNDKYRLAEKIGAGNFGTVYRGEHILLDHPVAVKVFRPAIGHLALESLDRFRIEGISACRISHPNAVTVLDFDICAGLAYLVMELLNGRSLADELRIRQKLPTIACGRIAACVCDVLSEAHAAGIVHRDIKPSNVFLHRAHSEETVKVIDFGVAKLTDNVANSNGELSTVAGVVIGTPAYMAPERLLNEPYDGRADVYAVGVMLYEILAGHLPFTGNGGDYWSLARMHIVETPPTFSNAGVDVPDEMQAIVLDAMAKLPDQRPTAEVLAGRLHAFVEASS